MEETQNIPEDLYDREARCEKAIRTVGKAMVIRIAVAALLLWVILAVTREAIAVGLICFALVMNLAGLLPLCRELHKQLTLRKHLRSLEPD